ncbi:MAG: hypothetical protein ACK2T7_13005 [Anaerolineales bacterium]
MKTQQGQTTRRWAISFGSQPTIKKRLFMHGALIKRIINLTSQAERAEAQVECAVILYQMQDFEGAFELLNQARIGFAEDDHKKAVVSWMIGIVLLEIPSRREEVIVNWVTAINLFRRIVSTRFHQASRRDPLWHPAQLGDMEAAVTELIENEVI